MSFRRFFKWFFTRPEPTISKVEAVSIAHAECKRHEWAWQEPVKIQPRWGIWIIHTNWGYRGANVRIAIDQETGEVTEAAYLPR